jgi:hypothetical protein
VRRHCLRLQVTLLLFLGVALLLVAGFLLYHLWLISRGTTTYEIYKWREVHRRQQAELLTGRGVGASVHPPTWRRSCLFFLGRSRAAANAPRNIYNQGLVANFRDALAPPVWATASSLHATKAE